MEWIERLGRGAWRLFWLLLRVGIARLVEGGPWIYENGRSSFVGRDCRVGE